MEIAEVVDGRTLKAYLDGLSQSEQQQIQMRVDYCGAVRVLPIVLHFLLFKGANVADITQTAETLFADVALAGILQHDLTLVKRMAVDVPNVPVFKLSNHAHVHGDRAASDAANAVLEVNGRIRSGETGASSAVAASFSISAARRINLDIAELVRSDLKTWGPIWPFGVPDKIQKMWDGLQQAMEADYIDWSIWIHWYNRVLQDRDWHPKAIGAILEQITREDWEKGPKHVNPMFDEVLALYLAEDFIAANPYGFKADIDIGRQRLTLGAREPVDMTEIIEKLRSAFRDFNRRAKRADTQSNVMAICKDALDPEIADLKKVISKYKEDAQALHFELKRYEKRLSGVLADRGLPTTSETASLIDDLRMLQDEICLTSEPVRAAEKQRHAIALERATDDQLLLAIRNCAGMATDGVGQMRVFATLAMKALANPDASADEKQMAWMFAYRMGIESAALIKSSDGRGDEESGFGNRIKEASDLMVATDKGIDVLQEAIAEGGSWVQPLLEFFSQNPSIPGT